MTLLPPTARDAHAHTGLAAELPGVASLDVGPSDDVRRLELMRLRLEQAHGARHSSEELL